MQLKGLVKFFTIAIILICLYQLSFTWIVRTHENDMDAKATAWVKKSLGLNDEKSDAFKFEKEKRKHRLLDSTSGSKIGPFGLTTYQSAKDKELLLGLDLQGGMSVTMEVGLDGVIKALANNTTDSKFNAALDTAVKRKANGGDNLVTLFVKEYQTINPSGKLATFFAERSNKAVKFDDGNGKVETYLNDQAKAAFDNTYRILRSRIEGFGLSSPNINPNPSKAIISIELAGVTDPERVRQKLITTANLQFFEVYTLEDNKFAEAFIAGQKSVQDYLNGVKLDSTGKIDSTSLANKDTAQMRKNENPIRAILDIIPPEQDKKIAGKMHYSAVFGYILKKDTALLNSYINMDGFKTKLPGNAKFLYGKAESNANAFQVYVIKTLDNGQSKIDGDHVANSFQSYDDKNKPAISMEMTPTGTALWAKMTTENVGKPIAIVLDNLVYSAPNVINPIKDGSSQISGNFGLKEAGDLADILKSGKLPAPAKIVAEQIVGPTLGAAAIKGGSMAFLVSFLVIFALMLVYYNTAGWVANIALVLNILFTVGILASMGFTLTSAGIAGLVLTIGMAVDTNVIIFERIKEELNKGKGHTAAVNDGYKRSLAPILDAHVTSFLTAAILFIFGLGPVLGFATTQMIGIALSLFCGILVSRLITEIYAGKKEKSRHFEYFTSLSRKIFKHASYKFIEYRKFAYGISVIVLILGVAAIFNGFDEGVEFAGGRSYTLTFANKVSPDDIRDDLKASFGNESPVIKTVGNEKTLNIITAYKIHETDTSADRVVQQKLYEGLTKKIPSLTADEFKKMVDTGKKETVLPSISEDLKKGAIKAGVIAILIICLYIFIRFRDWRYSMGTIVALLHDVLVTLAVFSFCRKIVPFPLEIDQHFIAAVLTVIGFSMNDTVIVYDRIREDSRLYPSLPKEQIINKAINQTLSRTVMTSLTVFLTILILFIFGGEVTRGFAFAMLVGVITGTYSSIFVAAPILVDFGKGPLGKKSDTSTSLKA
jgi:SecD/SecF fusion protein